jgi:hypothetical protein
MFNFKNSLNLIIVQFLKMFLNVQLKTYTFLKKSGLIFVKISKNVSFENCSNCKSSYLKNDVHNEKGWIMKTIHILRNIKS